MALMVILGNIDLGHVPNTFVCPFLLLNHVIEVILVGRMIKFPNWHLPLLQSRMKNIKNDTIIGWESHFDGQELQISGVQFEDRDIQPSIFITLASLFTAFVVTPHSKMLRLESFFYEYGVQYSFH